MAQVLATNSSAGAYTFASQPRALQQRKKYKDSLSMDQSAAAANGVILGQYGNIMYDRRVIRGNTYALNTLPAVSSSTLRLDSLDLTGRIIYFCFLLIINN